MSNHHPAIHRHPSSFQRHLASVGTTDRPASDTSLLRAAFQSNSWSAAYVRELAGLVGGIEALEALDDEPLGSEPFNWSSIAEPDRELVAEMLAATDRCCDEHLDSDYRTITRRLLAVVASKDPKLLHRRATPARWAAATVWLALRANEDVGHRARWFAKDVWSWFGVGNCNDLGHKLLEVTELSSTNEDECSRWGARYALGDVRFLHFRYRARLLVRRAEAEHAFQRDAVDRASRRRVVSRGNGRYELHARPACVLWTAKGVSASGRVQIVVALGESVDDPELLALTVPDARQLVSFLQESLDDPQPPMPR